MTEFFAGQFDVAVVGAGHAGIEAALAAARLGMKTVVFTINLDAVGNMPCNPAIGGTGKGHLVRELDALGGEMAKTADACCMVAAGTGRPPQVSGNHEAGAGSAGKSHRPAGRGSGTALQGRRCF